MTEALERAEDAVAAAVDRLADELEAVSDRIHDSTPSATRRARGGPGALAAAGALFEGMEIVSWLRQTNPRSEPAEKR